MFKVLHCYLGKGGVDYSLSLWQSLIHQHIYLDKGHVYKIIFVFNIKRHRAREFQISSLYFRPKMMDSFIFLMMNMSVLFTFVAVTGAAASIFWYCLLVYKCERFLKDVCMNEGAWQ